jgi:hypothetical protein
VAADLIHQMASASSHVLLAAARALLARVTPIKATFIEPGLEALTRNDRDQDPDPRFNFGSPLNCLKFKPTVWLAGLCLRFNPEPLPAAPATQVDAILTPLTGSRPVHFLLISRRGIPGWL